MKIALLVDVRSDPDQTRPIPRLPGLERIVARGDPLALGSDSFAGCLLSDYGIEAKDAPYAAVALAGEGHDPGGDYWMRADPVSLRPTMHRVTGGALPTGDLAWDEAQARANLLVPHLREEGCELLVAHPQRWYVRCRTPQNVRTVAPPTRILPLDEGLLPAGPDGPRWQRLMTEAQMILFAAEVDRTREAEGRLPANGIWIWGGGACTTPPRGIYSATYSDDVLALGLGRLSATAVAPVPEGPDALVRHASTTSEDPVLVAISSAMAVDLSWLESHWLAPLTECLKTGTCSEISVRMFWLGHAVGRRITPKAMRRWWRRAVPISAHA